MFNSLVAFIALAASALTPSAPRYRIGLQLYTVRDACAKDFPGTIAEVAKIGFQGVEFAGFYGYSAEDVRQMLDKNHLAVYGAHIQLSDLEGDNFSKTVKYQQTIGNHLIVVPWIPDEKRNSKAAVIATAHMFGELADKLEPYGIKLGYHNHTPEFQSFDGETVWDIFFANSGPKVYIQFDTGNALSAGVQAAPYLKKFPGRLISSHVKDFSATNSNALLGEGDVHWNEVIPILKSRIGPQYLIIEQESYPFPSLVCAEKCLKTLREMLRTIK